MVDERADRSAVRKVDVSADTKEGDWAGLRAEWLGAGMAEWLAIRWVEC